MSAIALAWMQASVLASALAYAPPLGLASVLASVLVKALALVSG